MIKVFNAQFPSGRVCDTIEEAKYLTNGWFNARVELNGKVIFSTSTMENTNG